MAEILKEEVSACIAGHLHKARYMRMEMGKAKTSLSDMLENVLEACSALAAGENGHPRSGDF